MAGIQDLLDQATAPAESLFNIDANGVLANPATQAMNAKQQAVAAAADQKKQAMSAGQAPAASIVPDFLQVAAGLGNTQGLNTASEIEQDLRTMNTGELWLKYGDRTPDLIRGMAQGTQDFAQANTRTRTDGEALWDTASGVASGFAGGLGNIAALGVGLVDDQAGTALADAVKTGTEFVEGTQSGAVNDARRVQRTRSALTSRDNTARRQAEIAAGENETIADLRRFGRDFVDTLGNSTGSTMLAQGTSEAVGSLLAGGPIASGLRSIGSAVVGGAAGQRAIGVAAELNRATGTLSAARGLEAAGRAGGALAWPLATAALEAGGAYTGTANEIMEMPFSQLEANSKEFRTMVATLEENGLSREQAQREARTAIANSAGQQAAAIQAPIAGATGFLTRAFERPFQVPSVGAAVRQVAINEPVEEAVQSATGQIAQNIAIRDQADSRRTLSEGVGEQSAQGALFGFTAAGSVKAPGAAVSAAAKGGRIAYQGTRAAVASAVEAGKPLYQALVERGDRILRQQENASPVSEESINTVAADLNANAEAAAQTMTEAVQQADIDQAAKDSGNEYISSLVQTMRVDPSEMEGMPESVRAAVGDTTSRTEAITRAARAVSQSTTEQDTLNNAAALWFLMEPMRALQEADPVAFDSIPNDSPAKEALRQYNWVVSNMENNPTVQRALRAVNAMLSQAQAQQAIKPVTEESLATPEGQQNVQNALAVAALHPDKGNLQANEQILTHAQNGRLNLTPSQLTSLQASVTLLRARQKMEAQIEASGIRRAKDVVSSQIVAGNDPLRKIAKSALQHTQEILSAVRGQNSDLAAARLEDFGKFVQHMQNKVAALNTHFTNGNPNADGVRYQQLQPNSARDFRLSKDGMFVNTNKGASIDQAQSIALEAEILADVFNGLVETFPDLGQATIASVPLVPELIGNSEQLAQSFRAARNAPAAPAVAPTQAATENISRMTDAQLMARLERTSVNDPMFAALDAEMTRREDAAVADAIQEDSAQEPTPVVQNQEENTNDVPTRDVRVADEAVESTEAVQEARADQPAADQPTETVDPQVEQDTPDTGESVAPVQPAVPDASQSSEPSANLTPVDDLYGGQQNYLRTSFSYPEEARTRLYAEDSPIASVRRALSSDARLSVFLGDASKRNTLTAQTAEAYQDLLNQQMRPILENLESSLQSFLDKNYSKSTPVSMREIYLNNVQVPLQSGGVLEGNQMNRLAQAKVLNLTMLDGDGNLTYQPQLLEQAALAGMQWLLSSNSFMTNMDLTDVADMTGMSETALQNSTGLVDELTEGMSLAQAKRGLADKIRKYWGLVPNNNADLAYTDGIPEAMAAEMLLAMEKAGLLELSTVTLTPDVHGVETRRDFIRVLPNELENAEQLASFQDAIEVASLIEPEHTNYVGNQVPAVAQRQMNNPDLGNTDAQKDALEMEQQTPFYVNPTMVGFFSAMGKDNLLSLFGTPITDPDVFNDNDLKSAEGRNKSVSAAYDHLFSVLADVQNAAFTAGTSLERTPIRYAYNMSRVGRMQMLGKYSPQSSKLMREAILPTRSTLDLSGQNGEHFAAYGLALAQALGIKVHKQPTQDSVNQVMDMLGGPLKPVVDMIYDWIGSVDMANPAETLDTFTPAQVEQMKLSFSDAGADLSMVGLHAVVDYARYLGSTNRASFETSMYLEADGVTNGPINAMALMSIGPFTPAWVSNIAKGGLTFGGASSLADIQRTDSKDLYQASTDATRQHLSDLRNTLSGEGTQQMDHLLNLMTLFNKDVLFDPETQWADGALELKRGIAKNPLTITIYGSGAAGISSKLVGNLVSEIYSRMSQVLQARKADPDISVAEAMFPNDPQAAQKLQRFSQAVEALTTLEPSQQDGVLVWDRVEQSNRPFNPKTFSFTKSEMDVLEKNMLALFVGPMRQGITDTVGAPLMKAVAVIRDAAQVQSIFLEQMFIQEVDSVLEDKEATDPKWRRGDFMSRNDLNKINKSLQSVSPLVQTGDQAFQISGQQALTLEGRDLQYGRALNGRLRTDPTIYAPAQAGVRAIPMMTIGMGDGMMMQSLAQTGLQGTLKIFDGMNMPLDKIGDYSERANAAVASTWQGNPHQEILNTFNKFMNEVSESDITEAMIPALGRTLFTPAELKQGKPTPAQIMERIHQLHDNLKWSAKSIDARHKAVASLPYAVDQMAAAARPYVNGRATTGRMTNEEAIAALNAAYQQAMEAATVPSSGSVSVAPVAQAAIPAETAPAIEKAGRESSTGVRVLTESPIQNMIRSGEMTEAQQVIYGEIRRSLAAKGYKIVAGNVEQLDAYIAEAGLDARPSQDVHGWVNIGDKTIYLVNPTTETLVHELVHAASFETVLAHYNGEDLGTNGVQIRAAIGNLETMMQEFLGMSESQMDPALRAAYDSAQAAILSSNVESNQALAQAKALNEFMAWGLTNAELTKTLGQKQAPALVRMAKNVLAAIKKIIWGRKVAPKAADDFLSNLQFNAGIVIRSQPTIGEVARNGELFHSTNRIAGIRQAFGSKIADLLRSERYTRGQAMRSTEVSDAQMLAADVAMSMNAHGFAMTPQESLTFRFIVAALATEAEIDTNALARAQELYTHVAKNLRVEDFMDDPNSTDPNVRYFAQEKYNAVMGNYLVRKDAQGRTSLLPSFLGLATVSDEFRSILSRMPLPKSATNGEKTLDAVLENVGTNAMDSLSQRLAGDTHSSNVQKSVDNLMEHVRKVAQDEQTYLDQYAAVSGGIIDKMNDNIVAGMEAASDALLAKATEAEKNASNALVRNTARIGRLFAAMVSEKNGAKVAEGLMAGMNASRVWEPLRTFIGDLVGRTESNANVYDMIKAVRSTVQQSRQQFRDGVPQILNDKFSRKVTSQEWTSMFNAFGKTDLSLLRDTMTHAEISKLLTDAKALDSEINSLEQQIQSADSRHWPAFQKKMKQLAGFMNTGVVGSNLLRNAEAISRLLNEKKANNFSQPNPQIVKAMDKLISLYALESVPEAHRNTVSSLVQSEAEGVQFVMDYLVGQRTEEARKSTGVAKLNAYKGYIPSEQQAGVSMQIAADSEFASLRERGYVRVAPYKGSSTELNKDSQSYYFAPLSGRAVFNQGIMQNVRHTAGGVDMVSGFTNGMTAGRIVGKQQVARLVARMAQESNQEEALMPVFDEQGNVYALERAVDPKLTAKLNKSTDLAQMIGVWRGRQAEEAMGQVFNEQLIDNLKAMYDEDMKVSSANQAQYMNLLDPRSYGNNAVISDAVSLFTNETLDYIRSKFGDDFWVRRDMIRDAIGERSASVGDLWNGTSNLSKENQDHLRKALVGAFGINTYRNLVKGERVIQNFMADMRTLIVVKSVVVPAINFVSNVYQLIGRGVPMVSIAKGMPAKLGEIDSYAKSRLRQIEAEAELRAVAGDLINERKLKAEIQSITDAHKRLSIWPLIQAGEFSSIADVGMQAEDLELTSGKLSSYIEQQVDKLPEGVRNAGRYALITKDTALFRGLQKSVQYGDFIAKAVLYDDLVKRQKRTREDALARITEEFVNYDRLPGRFRSYLENMGLLWFYNFKIRSTKVALSTIRNNPVHALMGMTLPAPSFFGNIGTPIEDNIVTKALGDSLGYSVGTDMAFRAPSLNPWFNLIH